jgi:hypothetical protein
MSRFLLFGRGVSLQRSFWTSSNVGVNSWKVLSDLFNRGRFHEMDAVFASCAREAGKGVYKLMLQKAKKEGDADGATRVFELLMARNEDPDEFMFQLLIDTLIDAGRIDEALAYLGFETRVFSLQRFTRTKKEEEGEEQDDSLRENDGSARIVAAKTLLETCPKSGIIGPLIARVMWRQAATEPVRARLSRCRSLLHELQKKGIILPNLALNVEPEDLDAMIDTGAVGASAETMDESSWADLLALRQAKRIDVIWATVMRIRVKAETKPPLALVQATTDLAVRCGARVDARIVEAGLTILSDSGTKELAWKFFQDNAAALKRSDFSQSISGRLVAEILRCAPSFTAANAALGQCVEKGFKPDAFTFHSLLVSLCRDGYEMDRVRTVEKHVLEPMRERRLTPHVHTATCVAALQCVDEGVSWKEALSEEQLTSDTVGALMGLLLTMGKREMVLQIWEEAFACAAPVLPLPRVESVFLAAVRACLVRLPRGNMVVDPRYESVLLLLNQAALSPSEELLVATLRVEGLGGNTERAMKAFESILQGQLGDFKASLEVIKVMVETLGHTENGADLVPELLQMAQSKFNIRIGIDLYNLWISARRYSDKRPTPEEILNLYHTIKKKERGLMPNAITFNSLIALFDKVPHQVEIHRHVHFLLHEWSRTSGKHLLLLFFFFFFFFHFGKKITLGKLL